MEDNNIPALDTLLKYFVGNTTRYRNNIIIPRTLSPVYIKTKEEKIIEAAMESCIFKSIMSCTLG